MALELAGTDVMENIWEQLEKTSDGKHIRYTSIEVEQLWRMGFVDAEKYDLPAWKRLFEPYRQDDGSYILNRDEFFALEQYRYVGEIHVPFDAMRINEGKYTDEGLDELVAVSIKPSCGLAADKFDEFFQKIKKDYRQPDNLILIKSPAKQRIKALLDTFPSPLRNLEFILDDMIEKHGDDIEQFLDNIDAGAVAQEAARQVSRFSSTPTSKVEAKALQFEKLKGTKKGKENPSDPIDDDKDKVILKKIKRSRKGFRG
jgi:hypothetical protein